MGRKTGFIWHEKTMWHASAPASGFTAIRGQAQPGVHFENAETKRRLKNMLDGHGITEQLTGIPAAEVDESVLLRFHTPEYVTRIREMSEHMGGDAGESTLFGPGSFDIARLTVGACVAGAHAVTDGAVDNGYVLTRPPGHHAERDQGRGFCIFSNIALAIMDLIAHKKVEKVAVVDWDVHHGNGTEQAFYDRNDVLTISIHQDRLYPTDTGDVSDNGSGAGEGYNINVPLPPGSGGGAYHHVLDRVVLPALADFKPDLIVIACGYDASNYDPLGNMMLLSTHYAEMTNKIMAAADDLCNGRLLACHEGGYSKSYVPYCGVATIDALRQGDSGIVDLSSLFPENSWQALQPHQEEAVNTVVDGPLKRLVG